MRVEFWVDDAAVPTVPFGNSQQGELVSGARRLMWQFNDARADEAQIFVREHRVPTPTAPSPPDPPPPPLPTKPEIIADLQAASSIAELKQVILKIVQRIT